MPRYWQDCINYFLRSLGLWLTVVHRARDDRHATRHRKPWNVKFVVAGLALILLVTLAINGIVNRTWAEPAVLALGARLVLSPWIIGFTATVPLMWNSVICGVLLFVLAGWRLVVDLHRRKAAT